MLSPPLNMETRWFAPHVAYTMAKFGMSMCVLGMAGEFKRDGIAVNALWPRTTIATAAIKNLLGGEASMRGSRKPEIMADAAYAIFTKPARRSPAISSSTTRSLPTKASPISIDIASIRRNRCNSTALCRMR